ncbi:MAG: hypothetical protein JNL93_04775 [Pelomonas sp.]|nr:hypothetical protein [Roseateles sp.]
MKRQFITILLTVVAFNSHASSGSIRFYGALVEPTCQTQGVEEVTGHVQGALRLSGCRTTFVKTTDVGSRLDSMRVFTGGLKEIALSAPAALLAGRATVQELVINYQ